MKYSQSDIDNVRKAANIHDFIPDLKGSGASRYTVCPKCGKTGKNKGLIVTHKLLCLQLERRHLEKRGGKM